MVVWVREPKRRRLTRIEPKPELELEKMAGQQRNERALNEMFCSPHLTLPSCFSLPTLGTNVHL